MIANFQGIDFEQVSRAENFRADILAKWATTSNAKMPKSVPIEVKIVPSIEHEFDVMNIDKEENWMDPVISYIRDRILPADKVRAKKLKCKASSAY